MCFFSSAHACSLGCWSQLWMLNTGMCAAVAAECLLQRAWRFLPHTFATRWNNRKTTSLWKKLSGVEFAQKRFEWKEKTTFFPRNCMQPIVHSVEIKTCILARLKKGWTLNGQFKLGVNYCLYQNLFLICAICKLLTVKKRIKRSSLIPRSFKAHS